MSRALAVMREAMAAGTMFVLEDGNIKLERGKCLPLPLVEMIRIHKAEIVQILQRDRKARAAGFLPLVTGEAYEHQIAQNSHVFIMLEGDKWNAWRESWPQGRRKSTSMKEIVSGVMSFELALFKARNYVEFVGKGRKTMTK